MPKYVGRRIVPKHGGIWDKTKEYEELIIVLCQETGVSYISKLPVPAGTEIFNEHYWSVCSQFSEQIRLAEDHLTRTAEDVHTELTETESRISKNVSETEEKVTQKLTDTVQNVNDSLSDTTTTLAKKVADAQKQLEDGRTAMQQSAASLNSRMNSIASGKTTDKETLDARVDSAGKTYDSFGAHLRSRADKFYANGMPFSYTGAVNLNTTEHQLEFSGNFIYLGAKGNKLLTKPEPVPYNPDALLPYISYDTVEGTLVTADWSDSPKENDIIVFVVDCKYPERSYGYFPFKVDGRMPFGDHTLSGTMLRDKSVDGQKLLDATVTKDKLADACVSAAKLARDALMSQSLEVPFQPCVFSKGKWEIVDEGATIHHFLTEYESGYYGGGIKVPRAERFDKLYVEMDYCNDQLMHYYVVGLKLVNLGSIASTDGKPKRITLEIPSKKLEDAGYKDDYIQIVFTKNSTYDMTMSNVKAHYFNVKGSYFGEDYSLLHEQADTNTKELAALSEKVRVNVDAIKTADANMQNLSKTISFVSTDMQVVMKQKSAFTGKKILLLGDSITALNTSERGWVRYFNEIIQPERFVNLSVSSARWCDYEDSVYDGNPVFSGPDQNHNNVMGNQVEKLIRGKDKTSPHYKEVTAYADFDMILIACGTNDGVPSGDMEGSFTSENEMVAIEELDRRAFASAFRYSIEKLQQLYPAAKIYICTPIQGYITTRSYAQSKAKGDYLKLLAGRMSLEVIDTFCCGICDIYEKKNANGRYLIDGLHPNAAGAKKIGVFNASAVILKPHLKREGTDHKIPVIIGVVEGDTHDIGKNLVKIMMDTAGFEVYDLGRDVQISDFVQKAKEVKSGIICMSTLMTTTMQNMKCVIDQLVSEGIRDQFKIMVGGGPLSKNFSDKPIIHTTMTLSWCLTSFREMSDLSCKHSKRI